MVSNILNILTEILTETFFCACLEMRSNFKSVTKMAAAHHNLILKSALTLLVNITSGSVSRFSSVGSW